MMGRAVRCLAGAALAAPLLALPAYADPVTPEQAQSLETAMRSWLVDAIGSGVVLPKRPVEVTAAGDHYRLAVPFAVLLGSAGAPAAGAGSVTADLKPLDQGKWAVDNLTVPSPGHFAFDMGTGGKPLPVEVDTKIAGQDTHGVFDPSFATPSTMNTTVGAMDLHITSARQDQVQHIDGYTGNATLTPTTAGRVDVTENVSAKGLSVQGRTGDDHSLKMAAEHLSLAAHLDEVDRLKVLAAVQAITRVSGSMAAALQPPAPTPAPARPGRPAPVKPPSPADAAVQAVARSAVRDMILTLRDIAAGGEIDEAADGLKIDFDGHAGGAEHVLFGLGAAAPAGVLEAHLAVSVDGLALADLPPMMAGYVPRHIKLRPFVAGISMADVTGMALDATAPNGGKTPDPLVLFSHGGVVFGVDDLLVDLGVSSFTGTARMVANSPGAVSGKAQITAKHFDALMQTVQNDPMLSQGFPVLVMTRGLGRAAGDDMVWDIVVENNAVSVNGTDLTAMLGGARK